MKKSKVLLTALVFVLATSGLSAFKLSSTLPLYLGIPFEDDVVEEAQHDLLIGWNWNVYFGGHFGIGVDCDFLTGGSDGLKVYGAFTAIWNFNDVWNEPANKFDPFVGFGVGWTDAPGYYEGSGINSTYVPVVEFTGCLQIGFNYWFADDFGFICKTKLYFNRGTDFLQITAGINIKLFSLDIQPPR